MLLDGGWISYSCSKNNLEISKCTELGNMLKNTDRYGSEHIWVWICAIIFRNIEKQM